jgi:hypothetical protein
MGDELNNFNQPPLEDDNTNDPMRWLQSLSAQGGGEDFSSDSDPNQYQQQQGYYDPNQPQQGYYDPNQYQQQQGYYDPNQPQQGYYDPNQYQQQQQGYYDPNQPQQGYYDPNQYQQQQQGYYDPNQAQAPADPAAPQIDPETGLPVGVDPMLWLESLAKHQDNVDTRFFLTDANMEIAPIDPNTVDQSQLGTYTPGESSKASAAPAPQPEPPAPAPSAEGELEIDPATGLPVGIDPMLWLESLAKHQDNVDTRFFLTDANMDTSTVDTARVTQAYAAMPDFSNPPPPQAGYSVAEEAVSDEFASLEMASSEQIAEQPAQSSDELQIDPATGLPVGVDPMLWLESLAKHQDNVDTRFFLTDANMDTSTVDTAKIAEALASYDPPTVVAPAYTEGDSPQDYQEMPSQFDPPSFLDELGSQLEQPEEMSDTDLSWLDELGKTEAEPLLADTGRAPAIEEDQWAANSNAFSAPPSIAQEYPQEAPSASAAPAGEPGVPEEIQIYLDMLGGISLEEARHLAETGQLNGEQQLAWQLLEAKIRYDEKRTSEIIIPDDDLPPAEMGEIPSWLQGVQVVADDALPFDVEGDSQAIFGDLSASPEQWIPSDLSPADQAVSELQLPDFTLETIGQQDSTSPLVGEADLAGSPLQLDNYEGYSDQDEWAKALDEEHQRAEQGIVEEDPTWFRDAIQRVADEFDGVIPAEADVVASSPAEGGAWLSEPADSDRPSWLASEAESSPAAWLDNPQEDMLGDEVETIEALPNWLKPRETASDDLDIKTWMLNEASGGTGILRDPDVTPADHTTFAELPPADQERLSPATRGQLPAWAIMAEDEAPAPITPPPAPAPRVVPPPAAPVRAAAMPAAPAPVQTVQPAARQRIVMASEPVPAPSAPAIVPATYEPYRVKLEADPQDHNTRLELARSMLQNNDLESSLTQYQTLVENMGELDNVTTDLLDLVTSRPPHPTLRRVLGDAYMRQGYLQEALDAYRGALDSL